MTRAATTACGALGYRVIRAREDAIAHEQPALAATIARALSR